MSGNANDVQELKERIDLAALVQAQLGPPVRVSGYRYYWLCPWHADHDPSFEVNCQQQRWYCPPCGKNGDHFDFLGELNGWPFKESLRYLRDLAGSGDLPQPDPEVVASTQPRGRAEPPPQGWREHARFVVDLCAQTLFEDRGASARRYLQQIRGLSEEVMRTFELGYNPAAEYYRNVAAWGLSTGKAVYLSRGITIPSVWNDEVWAVQVRRPHAAADGEEALHRFIGDPLPAWQPDIKYFALRGGTKAVFGLDHLRGSEVAVIVESQFDALLLWEEVRDLVDVVALAGAGFKPPLAFLEPLAGSSTWLVILDRDQKDKDTAAWWRRFKRTQILYPPAGNDVGDLWAMGGDLRAWIGLHADRRLADVPDHLRPIAHWL